MSRNDKGEKESDSSYWMTYMTIENTDHNLIPHFDSASKTPIYYKPTDLTDSQVTIRI
jgi:hypothetical protein